MTILEAIEARHSVRSYTERKLDAQTIAALEREISACNGESGLRFVLVTDDERAFDSLLAHYGKFSGVKNYVALIGRDSPSLLEDVGYYGERVALAAQTLGLNTCWVALTFAKGAVKKRCNLESGEKLVCVLALGYGATQGLPHKNKAREKLCAPTENPPEWFENGVRAAMLAPTAVNQQKFYLTLNGDRVKAAATGGKLSRLDLGIVKYHFEVGAGRENFRWE